MTELQPPENLNFRRDDIEGFIEDLDWNEPSFIYTNKQFVEQGEWSTCSDFHVTSLSEFFSDTIDTAKTASTVYSQVRVVTYMNGNLLYGLRNFEASVAVYSDDYAIEEVIDPTTGQLTSRVLLNLQKIPNYEDLLQSVESYLAGLKLEILGEVNCSNGITILKIKGT